MLFRSIQAVVLDIDKVNERFSLGIKQTQKDPWETVSQRYEVGTEVTGSITNLTDFGIFVEIEEGIEGLVHISEISTENIKNPRDHYKVGDTITAKVMNTNSDERRIGLSVKRLEKEKEEKNLEDLAKNMKPAISSFGKMLRHNIQEQIEAQKAQEQIEAQEGQQQDAVQEVQEGQEEAQEVQEGQEIQEAQGLQEAVVQEIETQETEKAEENPEVQEAQDSQASQEAQEPQDTEEAEKQES